MGRFCKQFLRSLYRSTFDIFFKLDSKQRLLTNAILLKIYFRNLSVQRSFLQYKSQCLEKVNVKWYVIKRLWHEIFDIVPGINPQPISALQLRSRAWYGSLGLIPGPIWKMSCNNLLLQYEEKNIIVDFASGDIFSVVSYHNTLKYKQHVFFSILCA